MCQRQAGAISLRIQEIRVQCETKTRDNVFVKIESSIQYQVIPEKVVEAYYKLSRPQKQIEAYVFDVIRATVPKLNLDNVFVEKEELARDIRKTLSETMDEFGYRIIATPITDIDPNHQVKRAMNEINRQQRLKEAAADTGEAEKIKMVKDAEAVAAKIRIEAKADADAKHLAGQGLARQRQAIVDGLTESVKIFQEGIAEVDATTVMDMIIVTQYFDMMKDIGEKSAANTVFIPHSPAAISDLAAQIRGGFLKTGNAAKPVRRLQRPAASAPRATGK